jgi:hypothetical protein
LVIPTKPRLALVTNRSNYVSAILIGDKILSYCLYFVKRTLALVLLQRGW